MDRPPVTDIDLSKPRYGDKTYMARFQHFLETTNPLNAFTSSRKLAEAATLVRAHRAGQTPPDTTKDQLWKAKRLYDSAYHPVTEERMLVFGRMSFQVPGNMIITGLMITFYQTTGAVIFWQSANQAFNALANFTNRSSGKYMSTKQIIGCGVAATFVATTTALTLNKVVQKYKQRVPKLIGRFVPFVAIAAANAVNIPLMRWEDLNNGILVTDADGQTLGDQPSKRAARTGTVLSVLSRITIAFPILIIPPVVLEAMERSVPSVVSNTGVNAGITILLTGLCLCFAVPMGLAIFPQRSSMSVSQLEPEVRESVLRVAPNTTTVYYNKGL